MFIDRVERALHVVRRPAALAALILAGCGTDEPVANDPDVVQPSNRILGDGTLQSVKLVTLFKPDTELYATDLDFNPARPGELWVVLRQPHDDSPCNEPPAKEVRTDPACTAYQGYVAIISAADHHHPTWVTKKDPNAWHFMRLPTGIAFGDDDTFATSGEARTGNYDDDPPDFEGPTLWSADPDIFAIQAPGKNGAHLDMLHASPFGMGIAHERDNVYWVFNGQVGALDRDDFHTPHEPGGEDHSDGESWRWALGEVKRLPGVPSGLAYDARDGALYVADTGNGRVIRIDTTSGKTHGTLPTDDSQMPAITRVDDATIDELVKPGILERPSGITLAGDSLLVTDNATSKIHLFDLSGEERLSLDTGLSEGTLSGITVGPDGKAYFADLKTGRARRIDPL